MTLVESHIFNPSVLNSFRFGFTRPVEAIDNVANIEVPSDLFFLPGAPGFGQLNAPGLSPLGPLPSFPETKVMNTFQFADDLLIQRGAHALKMGVQVHRYRWDVASSSYKASAWSFTSLESFIQGGPGGTRLTVALPGSDDRTAFRQTLAGFYIQDDFRASSRFQINLGLRYEFATVIADRGGKTSFLADSVRDSQVQVGPLLEKNPSLRNFSPRLGMSWSPWAGRDTVLSGGFGIYYDPLLAHIVGRQKSTLPFYKIAEVPNFDSTATFPDPVAAAAGAPFQARILDYRNTTSPMVLRYNFTLQDRLPGGWRLRASYVGARGNHLFRSYEANLFPVPEIREDGSLFFPAKCPPPEQPAIPDCRPHAGPVNPAFGGINVLSSDAQSFYNSLQLSINKALGGGASLQGSYTYSKSVDDASAQFPGFGSESQFGLRRNLDRGLSDFDIRHRLVIHYFYASPLGRGRRWLHSGPLSRVFGDWRLGGIVSFRTGVPFTPLVRVRTPGYLFSALRPNLLPGRSNNPILGGPEQYYDPSAYSVPPPGTLGNVGRNTLIAPSSFNMDISLQREFFLDAKRRFQFRVEVFNLLNHTNFRRVIGSGAFVFTGTSGRRGSNTGRIGQTATTARQIQFALRFSF
ncbi:MAG: TonB-dependent receptor [Acidobacteria bacterium]|nr:TonB-dependent receptor [Acidobacteriota bacterium]